MRREKGQVGFVFVLWLVFVGVLTLISGVCTEYTIEFWAKYMGRPVDLPFLAACLGVFLGPIVITAAVVTFLLSFVL